MLRKNEAVQGEMHWRRMIPFFLPVLVEQGLSILIGIVSTMMVSNVGDFAVSGVNLVDTVNFMVISVFNALAAGATVVVSQNVGARNRERASETAMQSIVLCSIAALVLGIFASAFGGAFLRLLYRDAEASVLGAGHTYFIFSGFSYVFLGLSASCGGVMRACSNPRTPMVASILANIVNVVVAFVLIKLGLGVLGVSIAMLAARATGGLFNFIVLRTGHGGMFLPKFRLKMTMDVLKPVLNVGVPSGVDSVIFNGARVVMTVFMSGMGTSALHANAIAGSLTSFLILPGNTISINMVTLTGRAYGAGMLARVKRLTRRLLLYAMTLEAAFFIPFYLLLNPLVSMYGASAETAATVRTLILWYGLLCPFLWPFSFGLPQMLRSTGDAAATMYISIASLLVLRVAGSWFFGIHLGIGVLGVWMGMFADWVGRGTGFGWRYLFNKWNGGVKPVDSGPEDTPL